MSGMIEGGGLFPNKAAEMAAKKEVADDAFEEQAVKKILAAAGIKTSKYQLLEDVQRRTNARKMTFDWFHQAFPAFPVRLTGTKLKYVHQIGVPSLFGTHFAKNSFFKAFERGLQQNDISVRDSRAGLVFNWPDISMMVLHNYPIEPDTGPELESRVERGTRIVRPYGHPVVVYVIESLHDFLLTVGNEWAIG